MVKTVSARSRARRKQRSQLDSQLRYQSLEARQLLAFMSVFDEVTQTLTINQTGDHGNALIENVGEDDAFQVVDFAGFEFFQPAENVIVNMLDGAGDLLLIGLDNPHAGDFTINTGSGNLNIDFNGISNSIGGDLTINTGDGWQIVRPSQAASLNVGGSINVDMGAIGVGSDHWLSVNSIQVGGDFTATGTEKFTQNGGILSVGGDVTIDNSASDVLSDIKIEPDSGEIGGDLNYLGGSNVDRFIADDLMIEGNLNVEFAEGFTAGGSEQILELIDIDVNEIHFTSGDSTNLEHVVLKSVQSSGDAIFHAGDGPNRFATNEGHFGNNVEYYSTNSESTDSFSIDYNSVVQNELIVKLADGENSVSMRQTNHDGLARYFGGDDTDIVSIGVDSMTYGASIVLGDGNDEFELVSDANFADRLRVDFGAGQDTLINNISEFGYDVTFLNLNGFDSFYKAANDKLKVVQSNDLGDVTVERSNLDDRVSVRTESTVASYLTPATDLRVVLLPESESNLEVKLDETNPGNLILNLRSGDRDVLLSGTDNKIEGRFRINGGDGDQNIVLSQQNFLRVKGNMVINLRDGMDSVVDGDHAAIVDSNAFLRNVNEFESDSGLIVFENFTINNATDALPARFDTDAELYVAGNFTYFGGESVDDVLLNDQATIEGDVFIDVGRSLTGEQAQDINLAGLEADGNVVVLGGDSVAGINFITDTTTHIGGDFRVNFSANKSNSIVSLSGTVDGGYGKYRGGEGLDFVTFQLIAPDMEFKSNLNTGDDFFELAAESNVLSMLLDFGDGIDEFIDEHVELFPLTTLNLP